MVTVGVPDLAAVPRGPVPDCGGREQARHTHHDGMAGRDCLIHLLRLPALAAGRRGALVAGRLHDRRVVHAVAGDHEVPAHVADEGRVRVAPAHGRPVLHHGATRIVTELLEQLILGDADPTAPSAIWSAAASQSSAYFCVTAVTSMLAEPAACAVVGAFSTKSAAGITATSAAADGIEWQSRRRSISQSGEKERGAATCGSPLDQKLDGTSSEENVEPGAPMPSGPWTAPLMTKYSYKALFAPCTAMS